MSKMAVIYWSMTGNTQAMAEAIADGAREAGAQADLFSVDQVTVDQALEYDKLALGCPAMGAEVLEEAEFEPFFTALEGRLDTNTAPQLEAELKTSLSGITELELDFSGLEYISSAGLRVLLAAQKAMNRQGKLTIRNVNETIREVFEITGFVDILTIV